MPAVHPSHMPGLMSSHDRRAHTFIVRVWFEPQEGQQLPGEWRGEAKHVPSGRTAYFRRLESVGGVLVRLMEEESTSHG